MAARSALALLLLLLALALGGCFYALDGSLVKKAKDGGADGAEAGIKTDLGKTDQGKHDAGADSGATGTDSSPADAPAASD